jgi:hypothetical protein
MVKDKEQFLSLMPSKQVILSYQYQYQKREESKIKHMPSNPHTTSKTTDLSTITATYYIQQSLFHEQKQHHPYFYLVISP